MFKPGPSRVEAGHEGGLPGFDLRQTGVSPILSVMQRLIRHLALAVVAISAVVAEPAHADWPDGGAWPHIRNAMTPVPERPGDQYSFAFTARPIDSMAWSSVFGEPPGGQIGDLEGISYAQAAAFSNAVSQQEEHEACYELTECTGQPADSSFACESIEAKPISCRGFRLPTELEIDTLGRVDRHSRIAQWSHEGTLVDARGVKKAGERPEALAGFLLVRTVAYEKER